MSCLDKMWCMELRLCKTVGMRLVTCNNKRSYGNRGRVSTSGMAATDWMPVKSPDLMAPVKWGWNCTLQQQWVWPTSHIAMATLFVIISRSGPIICQSPDLMVSGIQYYLPWYMSGATDLSGLMDRLQTTVFRAPKLVIIILLPRGSQGHRSDTS